MYFVYWIFLWGECEYNWVVFWVFMFCMHLFLKERQLPYSVRTSTENFTSYDVIRVVPLYAVGTILQAAKTQAV